MQSKGLSDSEVAMIKGIMEFYPKKTNQSILAIFSTPERTINSGRIAEIKKGYKKYAAIHTANKKSVDAFLNEEITLTSLMNNSIPDLFPDNNLPITRTEVIFKTIKVDIMKNKIMMDDYEGEMIEFKEEFQKESIPIYIRILAGMINAGSAGSIIFGVNDAREVVGINNKLPRTKTIEKISESTHENFEPYFKTKIEFENVMNNKIFRIKIIDEFLSLPIICKKNKDIKPNEQILREGVIYYRYGSFTLSIKYPELRKIINDQIRPRPKG